MRTLKDALEKAGQPKMAERENVVVLPDGNNFETQLIADGYLPEIEMALNLLNPLNPAHEAQGYLDKFINDNNGLSYGKNKGNRDYTVADGRKIAARDALKREKTRMARPLAAAITQTADAERQVPPQIVKLFEIIGRQFGLTKARGEAT